MEESEFGEEPLDKGDEFMAVKPWVGAIKEPTYSYYKDKNQSSEPPITIEPEFVYGYRSKDQRNNVRFLANGKLLYNAAALGNNYFIIVLINMFYYQKGIVHDLKANTQKFFNKHIDDIISLDLHPDGITVATGELGPKPSIYVWNSDTLEEICNFKGVIKKGKFKIIINKFLFILNSNRYCCFNFFTKWR